MYKSKVTKKGTITIPKKLRDKYGICTGDSVGYAELGDGIKIVPLSRNDVPITIKEMWQEADEKGITLEKDQKYIERNMVRIDFFLDTTSVVSEIFLLTNLL